MHQWMEDQFGKLPMSRIRKIKVDTLTVYFILLSNALQQIELNGTKDCDKIFRPRFNKNRFIKINIKAWKTFCPIVFHGVGSLHAAQTRAISFEKFCGHCIGVIYLSLAGNNPNTTDTNSLVSDKTKTISSFVGCEEGRRLVG